VLPGASIVATEEDTSASRNDRGYAGTFPVHAAPIGRYTIKVSLQGFGESETKGVRLETQQRPRSGVALNPAGIQESLTVIGTSQVVEVDRRSASLGQVINSAQVAELPLNAATSCSSGRWPWRGQRRRRVFQQGNHEVSIRGSTSISVQGMRENANDFLIDGVDNNELTAGAVSILPSV
jgi:hypothetical protein